MMQLLKTNMLSWRHSGFNVSIGDRIYPSDKTALGSSWQSGPLHYSGLLWALKLHFLPQERLVYVPAEDSAEGIAKVVYTFRVHGYQ